MATLKMLLTVEMEKRLLLRYPDIEEMVLEAERRGKNGARPNHAMHPTRAARMIASWVTE